MFIIKGVGDGFTNGCYDPIETDKGGNSISLLDIFEGENKDVIEIMEV